ncbi:DUF2314 domain-containing protein [Brachyspira murdochii]|uniref:DUF2314 domain-containing protein n=1 Tax=Brachyspira murdochii (strain ATCC 51284 / DSM 12563 / 56-150) TaxID=526224 RepID=D5UAK3_BRAM5|nr:DUF2314 domain-containing protein [Brachyspira murdochii]ADG71726.1 Protein of unknown function DUF2314 [Brachyspira murdochii DSM 12563]
MIKFYLENAFELNKEYPDTFKIPPQKEIDSLKLDDYVKLIFTEENAVPERMWVKITNINGDNFTGILDNDPYCLKSVKCGDKIVFKTENIIDTYLNS